MARMTLTKLGSNVTLIETPNGSRILFSYSTAVALEVRQNGRRRCVRVDAAPSRTTAKHLGQHADGFERVDDAEFVRLLEEA